MRGLNLTSSEIKNLAIFLLGQPNFQVSSNNDLRFGNFGSFSLALKGPKAGLWYDHEAGEGGNMIDLICRARNLTHKEAYERLQMWREAAA